MCAGFFPVASGGCDGNCPAGLNYIQTIGAGNLSSTVTDLVTWQRGLLNHRLLRSESVKSMTSHGQLNDGTFFNDGFGVRVTKFDGQTVIRHGGGISGFRADLAYHPDSEITIAVLANSDGFNTAKLSDQIARRVINVNVRSESKTAPHSR